MPKDTNPSSENQPQVGDQRMAQTKEGRPFALYSSLPYYFGLSFYIASFLSMEYLNNPWISVFFIMIITTLLDSLAPPDWLNPTKQQSKELEKMSSKFNLPLYIFVIVDWAFLIYALNKIATTDLPFITLFGLIQVTGSSMGSCLSTNHELQHRRGSFEKMMGTISLAKNLYMHYQIEHTIGHHKWVATPGDPTTAKYNEDFFTYFARTVPQVYMKAWKLERDVIHRKNTYLFIGNRMIWFTLAYFAMLAGVYYVFGLKAFISYLVMVVFAFLLMASAEYCEHYGLLRKKLDNGEYEMVNITHSWNAPQRFSNYVLLKVQRHSDHHENGYKPYQTLLTLDESPQLPHGYMFCSLLALDPPNFREMIHTKLKAFQENNRPLRAEENEKLAKITRFTLVKNAIIFGIILTLNFWANA